MSGAGVRLVLGLRDGVELEAGGSGRLSLCRGSSTSVISVGVGEKVRQAIEGGDLTLCIADRGPGFDDDTLPKIFEPLVTTKASGTGLGLALVKSVVERHGGHVSANNRPGGGAEVKLLLPGAIAPAP